MKKTILSSLIFLLLSVWSSSYLSAIILDDTYDMSNLRGKKIGYYTGSFDPIHLGHQHVIDTAIQCGYVDYVLVYPAPGGDSFKSRTALDLRQEMLASLFQDNPKVLLTYWSPKELQDRFSKIASELDIIGIIGSDVVTERLMGEDTALSAKYRKVFMRGILLNEKHSHDTIGAIMALKANAFIVALRDGNDLSQLDNRIYDREILAFIPSTGHSSTEVRKAIKLKKPFEHLLPLSVQEIIKEKGLYGFSNTF